MKSKRRTYKKKNKGVRYIAKALVKYQKKKYTNYSSALPEARKIYGLIKTSGEKVKLAEIWRYSRKHRSGWTGPYEKAPEIDAELLSVSNYWELVEYPRYILATTNLVYFTSKLFNPGLDQIQGGELVEYEESFSEYVTFINKLRSDTESEEEITSDYPEWYVQCTPVRKNKQLNRWETEIIEVNSFGDTPLDGEGYGYEDRVIDEPVFEKAPSAKKTPKKGSKPKKQPEPSPSQKKAPEAEKKNVSGDKVREVRMLIADLRQDVANKLISKKDYLEMVKGLYEILK